MNLRPYDFENDPPRIVKHLYTAMQGKEGINTLKKSDGYFLKKPEERMRFVAEIDGELIASLVLLRGEMSGDRHKFFLHSPITAERYRGKGITSLLFRYAVTWVEEKGGRLIITSTAKNNTGARKFFEKAGFTLFGELPGGTPDLAGEKRYHDEVFYYYALR
ncbi:MAG: GNAT family N-acetyltransferase [Candidatus Odinarchaeota archaeon]